MKVKLELEFQSLAELKAYIEQTTQTVPVVPTVAQAVPTVEQAVPTVAQAVPTVEQAVPTVVTPPPTVAPAVSPAEPAPMPTPQEPTVAAAPAQEVSTAANSYTLDDLARAGSDLVDQGKQSELPGLLQRFGITSLTELPVERYGEFATALREMGARI